MSTRVYGNPAVHNPNTRLPLREELFMYVGQHPECYEMTEGQLYNALIHEFDDAFMCYHSGIEPQAVDELMGSGQWKIRPGEKAARSRAINEVIKYVKDNKQHMAFKGGRLCLK